jgi:hypothetical protein
MNFCSNLRTWVIFRACKLGLRGSIMLVENVMVDIWPKLLGHVEEGINSELE